MPDSPNQNQRSGAALKGRGVARSQWVMVKKIVAIINRKRLTVTEPTRRPARGKKMEVNEQHRAVISAANSPR